MQSSPAPASSRRGRPSPRRPSPAPAPTATPTPRRACPSVEELRRARAGLRPVAPAAAGARLSPAGAAALLPPRPATPAPDGIAPCRVSPVWDAVPALDSFAPRSIAAIEAVLAPFGPNRVVPLLAGYSHCAPFRVEAAGGPLFVKLAVGAEAPHDKVAREADAYRRFGHLGVTPPLRAYRRSAEISLVATPFLTSTHLGDEPLYGELRGAAATPGGRADGTLLASVVDIMVAVHRHPEDATDLPAWPHAAGRWREVLRAAASAGHLSEAEAAGLGALSDRIRAALVRRGAERAAQHTVLHGDLHASNVRQLVGSKQAMAIDWGDHSVGDAAAEIAYFAFMMDLPMALGRALVDVYGARGGADTQLLRERHSLWLAGYRISRYAKVCGWSSPDGDAARAFRHRMHDDLPIVLPLL